MPRKITWDRISLLLGDALDLIRKARKRLFLASAHPPQPSAKHRPPGTTTLRRRKSLHQSREELAVEGQSE